MKQNLPQQKSKVNKGAPSGFVVSLIFHAAAFFIAGLFVVFTVVNKPELEFEAPPPVARPKMQLKKPKVKVRKSSQPKPSSRIVAKVQTKQMPEIQLPDVMGAGEGLLSGSGLGGEFLDIPEIKKSTIFGGNMTSGSDLMVTFYDFTRLRSGAIASMEHREYFNILSEFVAHDWDTKYLRKYYQAPTKLYASTIAIPIVTSLLGPLSFGEPIEESQGRSWAAHYQGTLVHKEPITFRFWGTSDDVLTVALDKEVVLAANFPWDGVDAYLIGDKWNKRAPNSRPMLGSGTYLMGNNSMVGSEWITLEPGETHEFDAIVGEGPGGEFFAMLLVEVQGEKYPLNDWGAPIFPVFATEPLSWELQDDILMNLYDGEANVTNVTTFFNDL